MYNVKQGWDPLVELLNLIVEQDAILAAIVAKGFPHVNDRNVLIFVRQALNILGLGFPIWILLFLAVAAWLVRIVGRVLWYAGWRLRQIVYKFPKSKVGKQE